MLKDNLPAFVAGIQEMDELLAAEQPEIDRLDLAVAQTLDEFRVDSMTVRTVSLWEELLGFDHPSAWEINRRRERIRARLLASAPVTPDMLRQVIESTGGVQVQVQEDASVPKVTVTFIGQYGIPAYMDDIAQEVERLRPYHVPVEYVYLTAYLAIYAAFNLEGMANYTLTQLADGMPLQGGGA